MAGGGNLTQFALTAAQIAALVASAGLTITDSKLIITDNVDTTKRFQVECSSIGTGQTRTWTVPDRNDTFAGLGAQTFTGAQTFSATTTFSGFGFILSGSPGGMGAANRYISGGGSTSMWYHNAPTGGEYRWNFNESQIASLTATTFTLSHTSGTAITLGSASDSSSAIGSALGLLIRHRKYGYSGAPYTAVQVGDSSRGVGFGMDPNTIAGGQFTGNSLDFFFTRGVCFRTPNAGSTDWETALRIDGGGSTASTPVVVISSTGISLPATPGGSLTISATGGTTLTVSSTAVSSGTGNGAAVIGGGLGVGGAINSGGILNVTHATNGDNAAYFRNTHASGYGPVFRGGGASAAVYHALFQDYNGIQKMMLNGLGALVLGTDPGGSDLLRIGGTATIGSNLSVVGSTINVASRAAFYADASNSVLYGGSTGHIIANSSGAQNWLVTIAGGMTSRGYTSNTNTAQRVLTIDHETSGTPANGLGTSIRLQCESSTTLSRNLYLIEATWVDVTDPSRRARIVHFASDTTDRECIRLEASGSAALLGFLGAAAVAQQAASVDAADVLVNFGLQASGGGKVKTWRKILTAVNLNSAATDVGSFTGLPAKYRVVRLHAFDASISLTTATVDLRTATGGAGTALVAAAGLTACTAAAKFADTTLAAVATTDYQTAATLTLRNVTAQGAAATASFLLEVIDLT